MSNETESAREEARHGDGKFGEQHKAPADPNAFPPATHPYERGYDEHPLTARLLNVIDQGGSRTQAANAIYEVLGEEADRPAGFKHLERVMAAYERLDMLEKAYSSDNFEAEFADLAIEERLLDRYEASAYSEWPTYDQDEIRNHLAIDCMDDWLSIQGGDHRFPLSAGRERWDAGELQVDWYYDARSALKSRMNRHIKRLADVAAEQGQSRTA